MDAAEDLKGCRKFLLHFLIEYGGSELIWITFFEGCPCHTYSSHKIWAYTECSHRCWHNFISKRIYIFLETHQRSFYIRRSNKSVKNIKFYSSYFFRKWRPQYYRSASAITKASYTISAITGLTMTKFMVKWWIAQMQDIWKNLACSLTVCWWYIHQCGNFVYHSSDHCRDSCRYLRTVTLIWIGAFLC